MKTHRLYFLLLLPCLVTAQVGYKYSYPVIAKDQKSFYSIDSTQITATDTEWFAITVMDRRGQALFDAPAIVQIKNGITQTITDTTDFDGKISLPLPSGNCDIEISSIGYVTLHINAFAPVPGFNYNILAILGLKGTNQRGTLRSKRPLTPQEIEKAVDDHRLNMPAELLTEKICTINWDE